MSPALPGAAGPVLHAEAADGSLIAYRRTPAGAAAEPGATGLPPVLLVHGFGANGAITWQRTGWVDALTRAGRDVVTVDLRGHGDSDAPIEAAAYRAEVQGADLAAVLDSLEIPQVDVVGYSLGSRIAAALARSAPSRVRRLVIGGAGPQELFASWDLERARQLLDAERSERADGGSDAAAVPAGEQVMRAVLGTAVRSGADPEALLACIEGIAGASLDLPSELPVLYVAGALDPVPRGAAELARERGAEYLEIPGRDHVSTLTSRAFKDAAVRFLS
ncbi:alpha/beta hydrolase [Agromyces mediolanus]|uniref:alpha/beta fold hydrolase n=1 Tax=Agromyces mediolanus TaxID=41986 RepID=UPI00203D6C66|nr:alpha/beta hydrolase [Agromyces mediolanus]MCM3656052.1 alpha/beta hydrolase [Agromyces mediolanus]